MNNRHQRTSKKIHPRKLQGLEMRESIMIYCEGETEVGYFSSFKKRAKCVGMGTARSTIEEAIAHKNSPANKAYDQYWAVFDKDNASNAEFDQAVQLALSNGIQVAWSNQCFELWFILHFRAFHHHCRCNQYASHLKEFLPWYNTKNKGEAQGRRFFRETFSLTGRAKANALAGYNSFAATMPPSARQSSTLIHELISVIEQNSV